MRRRREGIDIMSLNPRIGYTATTREDFIAAIPRTSVWDPHRDMMARLAGFSWSEHLHYVWFSEPRLWAATKLTARPWLSFSLLLDQRHLAPYWCALCFVDGTALECHTSDMETLFFFLQRLPLGELKK